MTIRTLSEAVASGSHTVGITLATIGGGLLGGGIIATAGGVGHRFDNNPNWKRPSLVVGLSMLGLGAVALIVGLLTK